jgi:hypothetical protein
MGYLTSEKEIKTKPNCNIGVGYTVCQDINFRAKDLINLIEKDILDLE